MSQGKEMWSKQVKGMKPLRCLNLGCSQEHQGYKNNQANKQTKSLSGTSESGKTAQNPKEIFLDLQVSSWYLLPDNIFSKSEMCFVFLSLGFREMGGEGDELNLIKNSTDIHTRK